MNVREIMTEDVTTLLETDTLGDALQVMEERDIRHLPVVRDSEVVGMLSDRDLRSIGMSLVSDLESLERAQTRLRARVSDVMSSNVLAVDPSSDVKEVVDLMIEEKISAVPVVEEDSGNLVGIVSYVDVMRALRDMLD